MCLPAESRAVQTLPDDYEDLLCVELCHLWSLCYHHKKKPTGLSQWHGQHFSLSSQGNCSSRGKKEKNRSFSLYTVVFLQPFWLEVKAWLKLFENTHKIRICAFVLMYHDLTDNHVFKQNIHVPYYRFYLLNLFSYVYLLHWRESIIALQSKEKKNHTSTI